MPRKGHAPGIKAERGNAGRRKQSWTLGDIGASTVRSAGGVGLRSPAGPRRFREHTGSRRKSGKVCRSDTRSGDVRERAARIEGNDTTPPETPPVSTCAPSCAIFLRKPSLYPLSLVKANVGRLCEKLKNAMRSGWEQRCDGNFWAIFAGTVLDEKTNFTGRFSE